jgi:hypothetical protein
VGQLRWRGATTSFQSVAEKIGDPRLATRVLDLENRLREQSPAE